MRLVLTLLSLSLSLSLSLFLSLSFSLSLSLSLCSPEPHILLFRRPLGTDPQSGRVDPELAAQARDEYKNQFGIRAGK